MSDKRTELDFARQEQAAVVGINNVTRDLCVTHVVVDHSASKDTSLFQIQGFMHTADAEAMLEAIRKGR